MAQGRYSGFEPGILAWAVGWDLLLGDIPQGVDPSALAVRAADALEGNAPQNSRLARSIYGNAVAVGLPYMAWAGTKTLLAATGRVHVALYREMATVLLKGTTSIRAAADSLREAEETVARSRAPASGEGTAPENGTRPPNEAEARVVSRALRTLASNLRDNIVGPLFYFGLFGVPGAVGYRVIHAVADRWGGRVDDPLSTKTRWLQTAATFMPSLISGLLVAGAAQATEQRGSPAWEMSRQQAREGGRLDGGWTEGALAGALGVSIEGAGSAETSPARHWGRAPTANDLPRARRLFWGATAGAVGASLLVTALRHAMTRRR
jgi:adenosylcobinamide-phosphate synthase